MYDTMSKCVLTGAERSSAGWGREGERDYVCVHTFAYLVKSGAKSLLLNYRMNKGREKDIVQVPPSEDTGRLS